MSEFATSNEQGVKSYVSKSFIKTFSSSRPFHQSMPFHYSSELYEL